MSRFYRTAVGYVFGGDTVEGVGESGREGDDGEKYLPRYLRGYGWRKPDRVQSQTAWFTTVDEPVPAPPLKEYQNLEAMKTIHHHAHLFNVSTPINVDRLEELLTTHPNQHFVASVMRSLRIGFWPWADTNPSGEHPTTWDNAWAPPPSNVERDFIAAQRDEEEEEGRFSRPFGPDLLPGMYSTPVIAVPKLRSMNLRLVSNQSAGSFCQNGMIDQTQTRGARMDTLHQFIPILLNFVRTHMGEHLVLWKSDVAGMFRTVPMHPLWQIKQITTSNMPTEGEVRDNPSQSRPLIRSVDGRATFGNRGSPRIWSSVMGLVIWIAIFVKLLADICCYIDDSFGVDTYDNMIFYEPYTEYFPSKQAQLLMLWDHLRIPHKRKKQEWGEILTIIGFLVDINRLTATLPAESKAELLAAVRDFAASRRRTLHEWQQLTGWMNWAFNVFPLFRPALSNVYSKMKGKSEPHATVTVNKSVREDLLWFAAQVEKSSGMLFFANIDWNPLSETDLIIYCDACLEGMGFWIPSFSIGFYAPVTGDSMRGQIFYWEALCVLSALHWFATNEVVGLALPEHPARLTILTDNSNSVDMFDSLSALPSYNTILRTSIDIRVDSNIDLCVLHVPGKDNGVADAISRFNFDAAKVLAPGLSVGSFEPPLTMSGAAQK